MNIDYAMWGLNGSIMFPDGTLLVESAQIIIEGSIIPDELIKEMNWTRKENHAHLVLSIDYSGDVMPLEVINALSILGAEYTIPDALQAQIDQQNTDEAGEEESGNVY